MRRYICRNVAWDHVLKVGRRARVWKKKWRIVSLFAVLDCGVSASGGSGWPMSSPEAVLVGPRPDIIEVRWDSGIW